MTGAAEASTAEWQAVTERPQAAAAAAAGKRRLELISRSAARGGGGSEVATTVSTAADAVAVPSVPAAHKDELCICLGQHKLFCWVLEVLVNYGGTKRNPRHDSVPPLARHMDQGVALTAILRRCLRRCLGETLKGQEELHITQ